MRCRRLWAVTAAVLCTPACYSAPSGRPLRPPPDRPWPRHRTSRPLPLRPEVDLQPPLGRGPPRAGLRPLRRGHHQRRRGPRLSGGNRLPPRQQLVEQAAGPERPHQQHLHRPPGRPAPRRPPLLTELLADTDTYVQVGPAPTVSVEAEQAQRPSCRTAKDTARNGAVMPGGRGGRMPRVRGRVSPRREVRCGGGRR